MIIGFIVVLILVILMLKYFNGDFKIVSVEEIGKGDIRCYDDYNEHWIVIGAYVDLKITYESGRVKYKRQKL